VQIADKTIHARRVLVVDDIHDAAQSFALMLIEMGHRAEFITDPRIALDAVRSFRPDIVFLDIGMPGLDGWQVATALRAQYGSDRLRIVAISGYATPEDRAKSHAVGFDAHIVKPASPDSVAAVIADT
jgi:CheY-like chemotaxis protein